MYKSSLNSNSNRARYKDLFGCLGTGFVNVQWFVFLSSGPPLLWAGCKFLISNPFLTIVSVSDASREGVQVLLENKKTMEPWPWIWPALST